MLRPLVIEDPRELTSVATDDYQRISGSPALTPEQREVWLQVYYVWMMFRFENSLEELSKMAIAGLPRLPPVEETPWGKELKERWALEGRDEGRKEGRDEGRAEELERQLRTFAEMHAAGELPDSAYRRWKDLAEQELDQVRAELARLRTEPKTNSGP